jgi:hypothetical protein
MPSLQKQLQDAIDVNDLDKAKVIMEAMKLLEKQAKAKNKKKAAKTTKTPKPPKVVKTTKPTKKKKLIIPTEEEVADLTGDDDDDDAWEPVETPQKKKKPENDDTQEVVDLTAYNDDDEGDDDDEGSESGGKRRSGHGEGIEGTPCSKEKLKIGKRKNKFFDDGTLESQDKVENNPQLAKLYAPAAKVRKGREKRKVIKAKVKCADCRKVEIIPIDMAPNVAVGGRYRCNDCAIQARGEDRD